MGRISRRINFHVSTRCHDMFFLYSMYLMFPIWKWLKLFYSNMENVTHQNPLLLFQLFSFFPQFVTAELICSHTAKFLRYTQTVYYNMTFSDRSKTKKLTQSQVLNFVWVLNICNAFHVLQCSIFPCSHSP